MTSRAPAWLHSAGVVVKDAIAVAQHPDLGDGYAATPINFSYPPAAYSPQKQPSLPSAAAGVA